MSFPFQSSEDFSTESALGLYEKLPSALKKQLSSLNPEFEADEDILPVAKSFMKYSSKKHRRDPNVRKILFRVAMLKVIAPDFLFDSKWFSFVYCYDNRGHVVRFEKILSLGRHVFVLLGNLDDDIPVVVKWYQSNHRDTQYEIDIYKRLRHLKCPVPWFSSTYQFWDSPILVMEKLHPLDKDDNEFVVAIEVIKQMIYMHQFAIHNDIKPGNIMKRISNNEVTYLIIDHGGVATDKKGYGFRRWIWSPKWTCQRPHARNQITTPKHDFIELGYTMKTMQNWRTGDNQIRDGFSGKLAHYMDRVKRMDERNIRSKDYEDLIEILSSR